MQNSYKYILLLLGFYFYFFSAQAQDAAMHKLYLKDGRIIEGVIVEQKFGESITLKIEDGERVSFPENEVELLVRTQASTHNVAAYTSSHQVGGYPTRRAYRQSRPITYRVDRSIYNRVTFALGFGEGNWGSVAVTPTIPGYSIGYRYNQFINAGVGVSLEPYEGGLIAPIFLEFHGDLGREKKVMPHYFGQLGYGTALAPGWQINELEGGIYYHWGAGYKFNTRGKLDWILTAGFKSQRTWQSRTDWRFQGSEIVGNRTYRRIVIGLSMGF